MVMASVYYEVSIPTDRIVILGGGISCQTVLLFYTDNIVLFAHMAEF